MNKIETFFEILFGVADSEHRWFIMSCLWLVAFLTLLFFVVRYFKIQYENRIQKLETSQKKCDTDLERALNTINTMERMITAMNSGYSILRGYMIARGGMDKNADSLILSEMNNLIRSKEPQA